VQASKATVFQSGPHDGRGLKETIRYGAVRHRIFEARPKFPFDVQHRSIILYDSGSGSDFDSLKTSIIAKLKATARTELTVLEAPEDHNQSEIDLRFVAKHVRGSVAKLS